MNISYRASKFSGDAAHGNALGDLFFDGLLLTVGKFGGSPGVTGILPGFYNSPSNRHGIVQGILFGLEPSYDRQAFWDEVLKIYSAGICLILHLDTPPLRTPALGMPGILLPGRNKCGGTCLHRQSCRRSKVCPAHVSCP